LGQQSRRKKTPFKFKNLQKGDAYSLDWGKKKGSDRNSVEREILQREGV